MKRLSPARFINGLMLLFMVLMAGACEQTPPYTQVTVKDLYTMQIPSFLSVTTELNDDASLQYENIRKEIYVLVINEEKESIHNLLYNYGRTLDLDGYISVIKEAYFGSFKNLKNIDSQDYYLNGLKAKRYQFTTTINGVKLYYDYAFVEGLNNYYQVFTWTLNRMLDQNEKDMRQLIDSFHEAGDIPEKGHKFLTVNSGYGYFLRIEVPENWDNHPQSYFNVISCKPSDDVTFNVNVFDISKEEHPGMFKALSLEREHLDSTLKLVSLTSGAEAKLLNFKKKLHRKYNGIEYQTLVRFGENKMKTLEHKFFVDNTMLTFYSSVSKNNEADVNAAFNKFSPVFLKIVDSFSVIADSSALVTNLD